MNYKITEFLDEIYDNCEHVSFLSVRHVLNKLYEDPSTAEVSSKDELLEIIQDYSLLLRYLNDFASVIYRRHDSSVEMIYKELCTHFKLNSDNKYTYEHIVKKLSKQTPALIMSLSDEDIKKQTIENFCEKLDEIKSSEYYKNNEDKLSDTINDLEKNINFVKMASRMD